MKILKPGHKYVAANFENPDNGQTIQFIEKELSAIAADKQIIVPGQPETPPVPKLVTVNDGTTNEEVLEILINRLGFLLHRLPCNETFLAMHHCALALDMLHQRTAARKARGVEGTPLV